MPTSARKSSVGGIRRGPQRAHIPYRGDNPEVGKKTGISVQHVERKSDGFEPFDEVIQQIDGRTPPRLKAKKRQSAAAVNHFEDEYDDEDGEQSMQIDSPVVHLANMRGPTTPTTSGRGRQSIRPVARTSDVDFDRIPSPHAPNSSRRSGLNGGPGPSSLRKSIREPTPQSEPASESDNEPAGDYSGGGYDDDMGQGGFDDYGPQESPEDHRTPRQAVFSRIEEEDENEDQDQDRGRGRMDEDQDEQDLEETPTKNRKGKRKAEQDVPRYDDDVENEIAQGLEDVGLGLDDEEELDQGPPPVKKTKVAREDKKPAKMTANPTRTQTRTKKENRPAQREGVRRSTREHFRPLEYWRGEKVVYGRSNDTGPVLVPHIKEILRIPKDESLPLAAKRRRGSTRARSRSRTAGGQDDVIPDALPVVNPEEGWDDDTQALCTVLHYTSKEEVERRIAWTAKMVAPRMAADKNWAFDKIFGDDDFIASGQLIIPPHCRKPSKAAKDNTYIFYVIEGSVNFKIHETSMILCTGGMFMVPRGNTYLIENICNRDARLFFTQARKVTMNDDERAAKAAHASETQRRRSMMRSSSAGAPSTGAGVGTKTSAATATHGRAVSLAVFPSTKKA